MDNTSAEELVALLKNGRRHVLPKGQVMGNIWDNLGLAYVESGYIKRYLITREGNQSILVLYGPGYIFPFTPVYRKLFGLELYEGDQAFYYEAMSNAIVRSIKMNVLEDYCRDHPSVHKDLFYVTGTRLNLVIANSETLSLGNSYRKLASQLVYFANHFGQTSGEGIKILIPLTNTDLASILNLTRETVSRSFSRLQQKGLVKSGKNITVLDIEKLRKEIY